MKRYFEIPQMEVINYEMEDVITASGDRNENQLPDDEV